MNKMIKQTVKPQASRLSYLLLALVMLGFGVFAQHHVDHPKPVQDTAQTYLSTTK